MSHHLSHFPKFPEEKGEIALSKRLLTILLLLVIHRHVPPFYLLYHPFAYKTEPRKERLHFNGGPKSSGELSPLAFFKPYYLIGHSPLSFKTSR
jgi:hypothetical protein